MRTPEAWDDVFMAMAITLSTRSKNPGDRYGAIIVTERHEVVSMGFNGPPSDTQDDLLPWHPPHSLKWHIHAEENAMWFGVMSRGWLGLRGCTLYCTGRPCAGCALRMSRNGISEVVFGTQVASMNTNEEWEFAQRIMAMRRPPVVWRELK
jgi:dCMP deaminase